MLKKLIRVFLAAGLTIACLKVGAFASNEKEASSLSHYIMAVVYDDLGDVENAIVEYEKALKGDSQAVAIHLNLAASLIKNNNQDQAIEELKSVVRLDPGAVEPHAILAILYSIQNKADLAASEYESSLKNASKLNPKDKDIYKSLGSLYFKQNKIKEAENAYRVLSGLSPADPKPHFNLGSIYYELKNYALSEKELKRALELNPDYAEALNFLGYEYVEQGKKLKEAEALIKRAVRLEPENGAYIDSLGWLYYKQGRINESRKFLEKAAFLTEDPVIYDHLGDVYLKLKETSKARSSWEKSLTLDPGQENIKNKIKGLEKNVNAGKPD